MVSNVTRLITLSALVLSIGSIASTTSSDRTLAAGITGGGIASGALTAGITGGGIITNTLTAGITGGGITKTQVVV